MNFEIEVNGNLIKAKSGETILQALNRNGIQVPTLCHLKNLNPTGACRMCVVEVEGKESLIPACSHPVEEWMKIKTHSTRVIKARKMNAELLLSNHPEECLFCDRNGNCELQKISEEMNVKERHFFKKTEKYRADYTNICLIHDPAKCILCGRCIRVCEEIQHITAIDYLERGSDMVVGTAFHQGLDNSACISCGQCILVCPTGALSENQDQDIIIDSLSNPDTKSVIQVSPCVSFSIAEVLNLKPSNNLHNVIYSVLRKIGFNKVADAAIASDIIAIEQAKRILEAKKNANVKPEFASYCPSWILYAQKHSPDFLPYISPLPSPMSLMGLLIDKMSVEKKSPDCKFFSVATMPCIAKKHELKVSFHNKFESKIDEVISTQELAKLIKLNGIDFNNIASYQDDETINFSPTGSGTITSVCGGFTEIIIRTLYYLITNSDFDNREIKEIRNPKGRTEYFIEIGGYKFGFAIVNGISNVGTLLDEFRKGKNDIDFVEVAACNNGCISGGGQPINTKIDFTKNRIENIYNYEKETNSFYPYNNKNVLDLYENNINNNLLKKLNVNI